MAETTGIPRKTDQPTIGVLLKKSPVPAQNIFTIYNRSEKYSAEVLGG
jgi:hypothetical protein